MLNHYSLESFGPHWMNIPHLDYILKKLIKPNVAKPQQDEFDLKKQVAQEKYIDDLKLIKERELFTGSSGLYLF